MIGWGRGYGYCMGIQTTPARKKGSIDDTHVYIGILES